MSRKRSEDKGLHRVTYHDLKYGKEQSENSKSGELFYDKMVEGQDL